MKAIEFYKISGSGNDFIIMDNRDSSIELSPDKIHKICERKMGVGGDGLILLNKSSKYDFKMQYFNNNGFEADMCGNGGRCIVLFAKMNGIINGNETIFNSKKGVHKAYIKDNNIIRLQIEKPQFFKRNMTIKVSERKFTGDFLNTGVPHFVTVLSDVENIDVINIGREIRNNSIFGEQGTNVNFISKQGDLILIRTYERGVEDETLACGTGSVAAAISASLNMNITSPIKIKTISGEILNIDFDKNFDNIYLEGRVSPIYKGQLLLDV